MVLEKDPKTLYAEHERHGATGKGLMIGDEERYLGRAALARGMVGVLGPGSVLDVGCGYGDLIGGLRPETHYEGIDYTAWVVAEARERHPCGVFHEMSFEDFDGGGRTFDLVAALGVLATVEPGDQLGFTRKLVGLSAAWVLISYLDAAVYAGRLYRHTLAEAEAMLAPWTPISPPLCALGDGISRTVLFRRPGF